VEEVNISVPEVLEYLEEQWRGHAALREEGAHTDLLLLCRGGGAVRAHRAVLLPALPLLAAVCGDQEELTISLPYSTDVARALVDLLYTGSCALAASAIEHLVTLAASLGLQLAHNNTNVVPTNNNFIVEGAVKPRGQADDLVEVHGKEGVVEEEVRGVKRIRDDEEEVGGVEKRKVEACGEVVGVEGREPGAAGRGVEEEEAGDEVKPEARRPLLSSLHGGGGEEGLVCGLCRGYLVDPATVATCMHSFCKSCIVVHVRSSISCPTCNSRIHPSRPLLGLRRDPTLRHLVYLVVPGLEAAEMARRRQFYRNRPEAAPAGREDAGYGDGDAGGEHAEEEGVKLEEVEAKGREPEGYEEEVVDAE